MGAFAQTTGTPVLEVGGGTTDHDLAAAPPGFRVTARYQRDMVRAYRDSRYSDTPTFEFFARKRPPGRDRPIAAHIPAFRRLRRRVAFTRRAHGRAARNEPIQPGRPGGVRGSNASRRMSRPFPKGAVRFTASRAHPAEREDPVDRRRRHPPARAERGPACARARRASRESAPPDRRGLALSDHGLAAAPGDGGRAGRRHRGRAKPRRRSAWADGRGCSRALLR